MLPFHRAAHPSRRSVLVSASRTDGAYDGWFGLVVTSECTWYRMVKRDSGAVALLPAHPLTPPHTSVSASGDSHARRVRVPPPLPPRAPAALSVIGFHVPGEPVNGGRQLGCRALRSAVRG